MTEEMSLIEALRAELAELRDDKHNWIGAGMPAAISGHLRRAERAELALLEIAHLPDDAELIEATQIALRAIPVIDDHKAHEQDLDNEVDHPDQTEPDAVRDTGDELGQVLGGALQKQAILDALVLAEDVLSRAPFSNAIWPNGMHPNAGIKKIRQALAAVGGSGQ